MRHLLSRPFPLSSYDYIVVGAGSAGCVIASQICERQLGSVCVLEAGGWPSSSRLKVPVRYPEAFGSEYDWRYATTPQPHLANRRIPLPAGKTLGGSSAINAMIYLRAHATDLCEPIVQDLFRRGNTLTQCYETIEKSLFDGTDGYDCELHPVLKQLHKIAESEGWSANESELGEFAGPRPGLQRFRRCQRNGRRRAAFDAFLKPVLGKGIGCFEDVLVQRIVFDGQRAIAVQVQSAHGTEYVQARKGIVISAGAIGSPQLLLASGIGPKDDLAAAGIPLVYANPNVGGHFQDHLVFPVIHRLEAGRGLMRQFDHEVRRSYVKFRTGPQASNIAELGGFFRIDEKGCVDITDCNERPTYQWHITPTHYLEYPVRDNPTDAVSMVVTALHPRSRGRIRVRPMEAVGISPSNEVNRGHAFDIDPNYMSDESDRSEFLVAVQQTRQLISSGPFCGVFGDEILPGAKRRSDAHLTAVVERFASTIYHYIGTCRMADDGSGVVGGDFVVHGCSNLTVCDASVLPTQISCNPQATVMALGVKWAEFRS